MVLKKRLIMLTPRHEKILRFNDDTRSKQLNITINKFNIKNNKRYKDV